MKKFLFTLVTFIVSASLLFSQEDPEKALTKAGRALGSYNLDPTNNGPKLQEALDMIDIAVKSDVTAGKIKTWQTRGEIYNTLSDKDINMMTLDKAYVPQNPDAPHIAAESFIKALGLAQKKYEIKDAVKGMQEAGGKLNMIGNMQIEKADYAGAFKSLDMVQTVNDLVKKNGESPIVPDADLNNHMFVVAYCAHASGNKAKAKELFKSLYEKAIDEPSVYATYFNILNAENDPEALKVLEAGRTKFPDNTEILFAEINYLISTGQYEKLKVKLQEAIQKEPNNPSIYTALGNVYMNLFSQEFAKDRASTVAKEYFDEALKYFTKAIELDSKQFDAIYSIGSMYFNKAVELQKDANNLPMDKAGQAKYKELDTQVKELMNTALPYFQKTESIEPNDQNTLIALGEIYARQNDFEKNKLFKDRLQVVKDGGKHTSSYFKL
jgi:tetratricopeptide (TPR) repeat protein